MRIASYFLVFVLCSVLTGCSGGSAEQASGAADSSAAPSRTEPAEGKPQLASHISDPRLKQAAESRRAVIRNASLTVRVPDVEIAERKAGAYVAGLGGFVVSSESSDLDSASPSMTLKLRVPVGDFDACMLTLEGLGKRMAKKVSGEDVTGQLVDLEARLKVMRALEDSFRNRLSKTSGQSEANDLQTRIMQLRGEIESLAAQRKSVGELAALSTVDLQLVSEAKGFAATEDKGWLKESWNSATSLFGGIARFLGSAAIFVLVFSPFWLPLGWLGWRGYKVAVRNSAH